MTAASQDEAQKIADVLVEQKLAACVGVMPGLNSTYRWEGKTCHASEVAIFAKTTQKQVGDLTEVVKKLHSYEAPCIVTMPIEGGFPAFLQWIEAETQK